MNNICLFYIAIRYVGRYDYAIVPASDHVALTIYHPVSPSNIRVVISTETLLLRAKRMDKPC
jgi:hypothetical protein